MRATLLAGSIASQAAVAIENYRLYREIRNLFDSFVGAAVTAIEARDPSTGGHSHRVAALTTELARAVDRTADGPFAHSSSPVPSPASITQPCSTTLARSESVRKCSSKPTSCIHGKCQARGSVPMAAFQVMLEERLHDVSKATLGKLNNDLALVRALNRRASAHRYRAASTRKDDRPVAASRPHHPGAGNHPE